MANFGGATNLVGGTLTITLPHGATYWYIQNQDTAPLKITFPSGSSFGPVCLAAATATGDAGDWIDSICLPYYGASVTLTSTVATAQFGSGCSYQRVNLN